MSTTSVCTFCGAEDSWRHSLIDCQMARCVWALPDVELVEHLSSNNEPNAKQWLFSLRDTVSSSEFRKVVVTLWAIWTARRKGIHEENFQSPLSTHCFIESYLEELKCTSSRTTVGARQRVNVPNRWSAPIAGCVKINADGAFFS